ncbi:uncharacterized protein LOC131857531 [Cryptomeria japonica]|uniref:uncharacterized protein LOC131857531 n=1 Tax=Cryptomeria japonica TaxID=3369 RepID=UPI0027DAB422|nr:uncharacterized protein LOC131857531 [Cryptomeria japonica]
MESKNTKDLEADILEYIKQLDTTVGSATHVNEVICALQPLASKLFNVQKQPGYIVQDNAKQAVGIQSWKDIAHEAFRHSFYSGVAFPTLSKVLLFEVASNWLACFPLSARVSVFDKFFLYAPASDALQALMLSLPHDHSNASHEEIDVHAVSSNAERILALCFVENDGIKRMALDLSTLFKFKTQQENKEGITVMEISRMAQLVASIPDKVRLEAPRVLSAHQFFKQVTTQLLAAAEERYKQMSENEISNIVMGDGVFTFIGETFARICRRGHADIVASEMIPTLLQHVRKCINAEDVMHASTESVETGCGLTFWQAITTAIKDSYAMERWTEALLRHMAALNLDDKEAYWMIRTLFDKIFMNQASIGALFTERFLLWKVFPISCLRWILQFSVFRSSPASKEHSQEDTNNIQLNIVRHLVQIWAKRDFIQSTSMEQQSYITAAIGMLESPISPVRKMASCVALVFSQVIDAKNPLFLDDENCAEEILDWEFGVAGTRKKRANIAVHPPVGEDNNAKIPILEYQNAGVHSGNDNKKITSLSEDNRGTNSLDIKSNRRKSNELKVDDPDEVIDLATLNRQDWTDEDDNESVESENQSESSLQPYDMSDDESDLKRETLPSHLSECVASLRKTDNPDAVEGALEVIEKLVRAVPDELSIVAVDLVRALVHVRCSDVTVEGEEESAEGKRHCSLVALLVSCPLSSVEVITKELYSPNVDVSQRLLILDVMADAAQELSNSRDLKRENLSEGGSLSTITELPTKSGSNPWYLPSSKISPPGAGPWRKVSDSKGMLSWSSRYERELPSISGKKKFGKSRRWGHHSMQLRERQLQKSETWSINRFPSYAAAFMLPVMSGYDKKRHGVDLLGRDFVVLGKLIYMLGVCMECVALHPEASVLAPVLLDMLSSREISNHPEAYVRISALFAASRILISLHPSFIAASLSGGDAQIAKGLEWIRNWALRVAEVDSDFECSAMATACVELHSEMAFQTFRSMKSIDESMVGRGNISDNVPKHSVILPGFKISNQM